LPQVERFYDALLPALGLSRKTESHVDTNGERRTVDARHPRNAIEYSTPSRLERRAGSSALARRPAWSRPGRVSPSPPTAKAALRDSRRSCATCGRVVEWSDDDDYPALFFEDPVGTRSDVMTWRADAVIFRPLVRVALAAVRIISSARASTQNTLYSGW
jgi:hypothetical protein